MASVPLPSQDLGATRSAAEAERLYPAPLPRHVVAGTMLAFAGILCVWPTALLLCALWTTDPLKSIGCLIPVVSLWLILRVWRALDWEADGSWWGLGVLFATALLVAIRDRAVLELVLGPAWSITLPPHSVVAIAYASGVVLLLGGWRLLRASLFPLALMWFVNPVPHVFNLWVDLPLQHVSAELARGLAHALGQRLTPDQLSLMFTPDFGMFIAPGCDGIRGSITMGLLALVLGYLYQFRPWIRAGAVVAGVLLGYVFNLLRLCALVIYYIAALHWTWMQRWAEMADYLLGATLFFTAAMLFFAAILRFGRDGNLRLPPVRVDSGRGDTLIEPARRFRAHSAAFATLAIGSGLFYADRMPLQRPRAAQPAQNSFPEAVGRYRLLRTWSERLPTGQTLFEWAAYAVPGVGKEVQIGVSSSLGAHDTLLCHVARGDDWSWHGTLQFATASGTVSFSGTLFRDGDTEALEATTICAAGDCNQWASARRHFGLVLSRPTVQGLLSRGNARPVPVLLRTEMPNQGLSDGKPSLAAELQDFLQSATLGVFSGTGSNP